MHYRTLRSIRFGVGAFGLALLALWTLVPLPRTTALLADGARSASDLDKAMKRALLQRDLGVLADLIDEAASIEEAAVVKSILDTALKVDSRETELRAFNALKSMTDAPRKTAIFQEVVKNPSVPARILLLGVVFHHRGEGAAMGILTQAVRDPNPEICYTALKWLREAKDPDRACPPLIEYLATIEKAGHGRRFHDVLNTLRELAGKPTLEKSVDWRTYWESRKAGRVQAPEPTGQRTQVAKQTFFTRAIESDRIVFIIDTSESMLKKDPPLPEKKGATSGDGRTTAKRAGSKSKKESDDDDEDGDSLPAERQRLYRVKQELIRVIEGLPQHVHFTVQTFNNVIAFVDDPPKLLAATPDNKKRVIAWVKEIRAAGETWTDTAFLQALAALKDVDTVYLLSDGQPYRKRHLDHDTVLEDIKTANRFRKVRVHTFGFVQAGGNLQSFLQRLAKQNDGVYYGLR